MIAATPEVLAHADSAFDVGGARMTLTTAELLSRLEAVYPDTYGSWGTRQLDDALREHVMWKELPGRDRFGYWHGDIIRARSAVGRQP